jgi:hypothetical protein
MPPGGLLAKFTPKPLSAASEEELSAMVQLAGCGRRGPSDSAAQRRKFVMPPEAVAELTTRLAQPKVVEGRPRALLPAACCLLCGSVALARRQRMTRVRSPEPPPPEPVIMPRRHVEPEQVVARLYQKPTTDPAAAAVAEKKKKKNEECANPLLTRIIRLTPLQVTRLLALFAARFVCAREGGDAASQAAVLGIRECRAPAMFETHTAATRSQRRSIDPAAVVARLYTPKPARAEEPSKAESPPPAAAAKPKKVPAALCALHERTTPTALPCPARRARSAQSLKPEDLSRLSKPKVQKAKEEKPVAKKQGAHGMARSHWAPARLFDGTRRSRRSCADLD